MLADALKEYLPDLNEAERHELARLSGVMLSEPYRAVPARLHFEHRSRRVELTGLNAQSDLRRLIDAELRPVELPPEGLVLTTKLAEILSKQGILPGIKVDPGAVDLPGSPAEKITEGLDGLPKRIAEYHQLGARFAKWRAVIDIADGIPTSYCIHTNAHALARYARICQEGGIVPIVEPEVLMDGAHDIA